MKKLLVVLGVIVIIVLVIGASVSGMYNKLVGQEESVKSSWSQVENVYQRRSDLIPNLVETVKGYAKHEAQVLTDVTNARASVGQIKIDASVIDDPQKFQSFQRAQDSLSSALTRLLAVSENYPNLKANENFLSLQSQLEGTENRITVERRRYNETAMGYNTSIRQFPTVIIARLFGFTSKQYFTATPGAEKVPDVKF